MAKKRLQSWLDEPTQAKLEELQEKWMRTQGMAVAYMIDKVHAEEFPMAAKKRAK